MEKHITERQTRNWPLYWFAVLEQAVSDGDHKTAAGAQKELANLGVMVQYGQQQDVCQQADRTKKPMENKLSTLRDLANRFKRFGLSINWLKAEAEAGRIPSFRAGRKLLFDPEAVEQSLLRRARDGNEASDISPKKAGADRSAPEHGDGG